MFWESVFFFWCIILLIITTSKFYWRRLSQQKLGHYREMAWLPFQKRKRGSTSVKVLVINAGWHSNAGWLLLLGKMFFFSITHEKSLIKMSNIANSSPLNVFTFIIFEYSLSGLVLVIDQPLSAQNRSSVTIQPTIENIENFSVKSTYIGKRTFYFCQLEQRKNHMKGKNNKLKSWKYLQM